MRTLAIDTSLAEGSVAALEAGDVAESALPAGDHARLLAQALVDVAGRLGWSPRDAELVAVVRGPGSFTGLRIGVATAKAIAWAGGARLVGVSAFDLIARRTARSLPDHAGPVAIAFDAGRGDVAAGELAPRTAWLAALPPAACVSGPALALAGDPPPARVRVAPRAAWWPTAAEAGATALLLAAAGRLDDPAALVPDYLRPSYADEKRPR